MLEDTNWILYCEDNSGLTCDSLSTLTLDNIGSIWIGTPSGGLIHFTGTVGIEKEEKYLQQPKRILKILSNPCRKKVSLEYSILEKTDISMQVYDISGRLIKTLVQGYCDSGTYLVNWLAPDLSAGVYFVRLNTSCGVATGKLILVK